MVVVATIKIRHDLTQDNTEICSVTVLNENILKDFSTHIPFLMFEIFLRPIISFEGVEVMI